MIQVIEEHTEDRYNLTLMLFSCVGFLMDAAHLFIMNADSFWIYKFRTIDEAWTNATGVKQSLINETKSYFSLIGITVPIAVIACDIFFLKKLNTIYKFFGCFCGYTMVFASMILFAILDTDTWQRGFFYTIIAIYLLATIVKNLFFATLIHTFTGFPVIFIVAVTCGQAFCGIFTSTLQIIVLLTDVSPKTCGLIFFSTGLSFILVIIGLFFVLLKHSKFFHHRVNELALKQKNTKQPPLSFIGAVFRRQRVVFFSLLISAGGTKMVQPELTSTIHSEYFGEGYIWNETYFVPAVTLLTFYLFDFLGMIGAIKVAEFIPNRTILIFAICRFVIIPLFMVLDVTEKKEIGLVFRSDICYIIFQVLLGVTDGLGINICIVNASRKYENAGDESGFTVLFMLLGIMLSDIFSSLKSVITILL